MTEKQILYILSFNAGELTPELDTRVDVDQYQRGCRVMENVLLLVQGGAKRMPGTKYVATVKGD